MKQLLSICLLTFALLFASQSISAQTSRTRVSTVIRTSNVMLDTLTNADTLSYTFPGRVYPHNVQVQLNWYNLSGTIRDTVIIYTQSLSSPRLNTTNTTTAAAAAINPDYVKWGTFVIGATGLVGGTKDTSFSFSVNPSKNIKIVHKTTGTQSTKMDGAVTIYTASNQRAQ